MTKRVLIAGESWVTHSIHTKGFDSFTTTEYNEGVRWLLAQGFALAQNPVGGQAAGRQAVGQAVFDVQAHGALVLVLAAPGGPVHAREHIPQGAVDHAQRGEVHAAGAGLRGKVRHQALQHGLEQPRIKEALRLREAAQACGQGAQGALRALQPAGLAEPAHGGDDRVEQAEQKQREVIALVEGAPRVVLAAVGMMQRADLVEHTLELLDELEELLLDDDDELDELELLEELDDDDELLLLLDDDELLEVMATQPASAMAMRKTRVLPRSRERRDAARRTPPLG